MRHLAHAALLLITALVMTACTESGRSIPFVTVAQGDQTGLRESEVLLFTEPAAWEEHWRRHATSVKPDPARPPVDFATESVLAIYLGEASKAGHAVEVTRIAMADGRLKVAVKMTIPRRSEAGTNRAFHIVKFPKVPPDTVLEVTWR